MKSNFLLKCTTIVLFTVFLFLTIVSSVMLIFGIGTGVFVDEAKQQEMKADMLENVLVNSTHELTMLICPRSEYFPKTSRNVMYEVIVSDDKVLYSSVTDEKIIASYTTTFTESKYVDVYVENETEIADNGEPVLETTTLSHDEQNGTKRVVYEYTINSYLKETLVEKDSFYYLNIMFDLVANNQAKINITIVISVIIALISLIFIMCSAGHKKGKSELYVSKFDKIPFEILLALLVGIAILTFLLCLWTIDIVYDNFSYYDDLVFLATPYMFVLIFVLLLLFCFCFAMILHTFAVRVKNETLFKSTITYKIWILCVKIIKAVFRNIKKFFKGFCNFILKLPLVWKTAVAVFCLAFVEFFILAIDWGYWWPSTFIINGIIGVGAILLAILLKRIKKGTEEIAQGNIYKKIDTQYMFGEVKQHAENINNINDGIARAVEERMKSERFKTELITNVSHDIKTPLTSIINYVDLLEKEEIENDTAKEYISVLSRQSGRLKKLIEDLIEASKASTGNLTVNFASFELGILLAQAIGEYEERMKMSNLDIVLRKPETPVYIVADSRHIWRIFDNVLNNIIKYSQPNTRVYIDVEQVGQYAEICFKNISKDELNVTGDELMERFVRGDSSRNTEGSGLGLSIAKSLAELQKGKLKIDIDGDLFKVKIAFPIA